MAEECYRLRQRHGVSRGQADVEMRRDAMLVGATLMRGGGAEGLLRGPSGTYAEHLRHLQEVIGLREGVRAVGAMTLLMLPALTVFLCDTQTNLDPSAEQLVDVPPCRGGRPDAHASDPNETVFFGI